MKPMPTLIEEAVDKMASLPTIGRKTALRLVLHFLKKDPAYTERLSEALLSLRRGIRYCQKCHHMAEDVLCGVCASPHRDHAIICVVENIHDIWSIENTGQYKGAYHVLGGLIEPLKGISAEQLHVDSLEKRIVAGPIKELIFALSTTLDGDTTTLYLAKRLAPQAAQQPLRMSTLARGIAVGSELEFTDELTLGRSLLRRTEHDLSFSDPANLLSTRQKNI